MSTLLAKPFRHYIKEHRLRFTYGVLSLFMVNSLDVLTPLALKMGIDAIHQGQSPGQNQSLHLAIAAYIALMTGVTVFRYAWRIHFGRFHHSVADDLRNRIFTKLTTLGPSFFQKKPAGELMSLLTNDVNSFRMAIGPGLLIFLDAIFYTAMILPIMIYLSWDWTWKTLILLPFIPFFMRKMEKLIYDLYKKEQDRLADVSAQAQEIVSGIRAIKSFAQEDNRAQTFNFHSRAYEDASNKMAKADAVFGPVMDGAVAMGSVILLWICTPEVLRGAISLGTFVAFHEYIRRMIWPMTAIGMSVSMIEQGRASFTRVRELLETETDIPDLGEATIDRFENLEVRHLSFRYPGAPTEALRNLSFNLRAGETLGVVGTVGSGKSTLLQLICRLYSVPQNTVFINGTEISKLKRESLAQLISLVPQDAFLFSDTVSENIAFGFERFPGPGPVESAATVVNMDAEIRSLPSGYDAELGERGVNLSGGQKQRLTIARALIRRSRVVMLDDSLSAVDGKTERLIVDSLKEAKRENPEQAVVLVSHRLATLQHADRILVLDRGAMEALGTHEELLRTSPTYRHLYELQTGSGLFLNGSADSKAEVIQ